MKCESKEITMRPSTTVACIFCACIFGGCGVKVAENQMQPLPSPSQEYILEVPIEPGVEDPSNTVWRVTIKNWKKQLRYRDMDSTFESEFNVYWCWDDDDRVWLFNSHDDKVYFWAKLKGLWGKHYWGYSRKNATESPIEPPETLYPY